MSGIILRMILYAVIFTIISMAIRKIWNDWSAKFKADDEAVRQRDLKERERPDVVDLKKGDDGVFRPGDKDKSEK